MGAGRGLGVGGCCEVVVHAEGGLRRSDFKMLVEHLTEQLHLETGDLKDRKTCPSSWLTFGKGGA